MSYQQSPAANTSTSTTVMQTQQPTVIYPQQPTYNPFAVKALATKKLGILQLVIGIVVFIMGIVMIPIAPRHWASYAGGGIWSGIFIIVAGSLCLAAGSSPERYGIRYAALTLCIISLVFLSASGLLNLIAFATQIIYDYSSLRGAILSLILSILLILLFVITIISAINTGRGCCNKGCCNQGYPSGYIVYTQPVMAPSGVVAVSNHQATTIPMVFPNQPYEKAPGGHQPPYSGYQPPASGYQPPTSASQPPTSADQPPVSGYQPEAHPFPSQQQQCNQAATGQNNVIYGVDYSQQNAGIPKGEVGDAPPPYNPNP